MKIHHDLIGTVSSVERYHGDIEKILSRFEKERTSHPKTLSFLHQVQSNDLLEAVLQDTRSIEHMTDGVLIELIGMHFFGLLSSDFDTMEELINTIRKMYREENP